MPYDQMTEQGCPEQVSSAAPLAYLPRCNAAFAMERLVCLEVQATLLGLIMVQAL